MSARFPRWRKATLLLSFGLAWNGCAGRSHDEDVDALRRENDQLRQLLEVRQELGDEDADALRRERDQLRHYLKVYQERYGALDSGWPRGSVSATKGELIGVTMGSRDHVRVGDVLVVYRPNYTVGNVRVVAVDENCCVAEVVDIAPTVAPAVGDVVAPRPD